MELVPLEAASKQHDSMSQTERSHARSCMSWRTLRTKLRMSRRIDLRKRSSPVSNQEEPHDERMHKSCAQICRPTSYRDQLHNEMTHNSSWTTSRPSSSPVNACVPSGSPQPFSKFTFDVLVHLRLDSSLPSTTMRRVLLDTGAAMNIISNNAYRELQSPISSNSSWVRGIAGRSKIVGSTRLAFHFLDSVDEVVFEEEFHVLDEAENALFDIILDQDWIIRNPQVSMELMKSRCVVRP